MLTEFTEWMKAVIRLLRKYSYVFTKKDLFIKAPALLTGVRYVKHLFQMQRLNTKIRTESTGISDILLLMAVKVS